MFKFCLLLFFLVSIGVLMKDQKKFLKNLHFWRFAAPKTLKNHPKMANLMKNVILVIFTQSYSACSSFFLVSIGILMKDQKNILKNLEFWRFADHKTLKIDPKNDNLMKNVILRTFTQSYDLNTTSEVSKSIFTWMTKVH